MLLLNDEDYVRDGMVPYVKTKYKFVEVEYWQTFPISIG